VPNMTRQDGSAMERLLATRMGQGPLVRYQAPDAQPGGPELYVPALQQTAQPVPKPRGQAAVHRRLHPRGKDQGQAPPGSHRQPRHHMTQQTCAWN